MVTNRRYGDTHHVVSLDDLVPEPGEVVDSEFVLPSVDTDENVQTFQNLHLRKPPSRDERKNWRRGVKETSVGVMSDTEQLLKLLFTLENISTYPMAQLPLFLKKNLSLLSKFKWLLWA